MGKQQFIQEFSKHNMVKLVCNDYGFECPFVAESENMDDVIKEFGEHTTDEHGIEYQKEVLKQFVLRKYKQ